MGFIKSIFGNSQSENSSFDWKVLDTISQLDRIVTNSNTRTQVIFKHSTRCGISSGVLRKFEKQYATAFEAVDFYYLDLIAYRAISNGIAERFAVIHQSPQLLVFKDGVVASNASHYDIIDLRFD